jgi:hypothetical protein
MPLNDISTEQTKAIEKTQAATDQLLDYLATHPDVTIIYHASDMILYIHSDASYLSVSNTRSFVGGLFFCGEKPSKEETLNGSILNVASVIKKVVASAAESEVGACFQNAQSGAPIRVTLTELGHTQSATPHDAVIPYHLWDSRLTRLWAGNELLKPHTYGMPQAAEVWRQRFCLRYWKMKVRKSFSQWFNKRFSLKSTHLRMVTRIPCEEGHTYFWTKTQRARHKHYHQSFWGGK